MTARAGVGRILVTGAGGFVGRHLIADLVADPAGVDGIVAATLGGEPVGHDVEALAADLCDREAASRLVREARPDAVIHLAGFASVGQAAGMGEDAWRGNVLASLNLGAALARHAPRATLLFASSSEVYGASFNRGVMTEDDAVAPQSAYGRTKAAAEAALADVLGPYNRLIVCRPFNHIGPGQDERFVVPAFAAQIARIERGLQPPVLKVGNLTAQRDFLDVRDVVAAYRALISASDLPRVGVYNIASGKVRRVSDILDRLLSLSTTAIDVTPDPARFRASDIPIAAGNADKLAAAVGWQARRDALDTLAEVLDGFRAGA